MTEKENLESRTEARSRVKKKSNGLLLLLTITVVLASGFYFYDSNLKNKRTERYDNGSTHLTTENQADPGTAQEAKTPSGSHEIDGNNQAQTDSTKVNLTLNGTSSTEAGSTIMPPGQNSSSIADASGGTTPDSSSFDVAPYVADSTDSGNSFDYGKLIAKLNTFYSHLDAQPYMRSFNLQGSSKDHFSKLVQKLLDNPPVVTRETDDLFTLLKNTAHFFRILGKENITVLKGILDRERGNFENILKTFYTLTYSPTSLKSEYGIDLNERSLYDYAAFFLHTMGGRLYLFRRDSTSRLAVSFYAILVIDRANDRGNSPLGIDIRPAIRSLIDEIENGGKNLKYREEYLDKLYTLQEKYS